MNAPLKDAVTFKVDQVEVADKLLPEIPTKVLIRQLVGKHVKTFGCQPQTIVRIRNHALIAALHYAYAQHRPLILSPDHIWLVLCQGFARHVKVNAEALRSKLVAHEGKIVIELLRNDLKRDNLDFDWEGLLPDFSAQIREHIGDDLHDLLTPTFSTTTPVEKVAYEVTLMDAMSPYFGYSTTYCGIPAITLEGTPDDWRMMLSQVGQFRQYDLDWWIDNVEPILEQFVAASEGRADEQFWRNIYKRDEESGGPFISGWVLKLFPYIGPGGSSERNPYIERDPNPKPGEWGDRGVKPDKFPSVLSSCIVHCDDREQKWNAAFYAGFVGLSQVRETFAIRPEIGWAVRDETAGLEELKAWPEPYCNIEKFPPYIEISAIYNRARRRWDFVEFREGVFYITPGDSLPQFDPTIEWDKYEFENLRYRYPVGMSNDWAFWIINDHLGNLDRLKRYDSTPNPQPGLFALFKRFFGRKL